MNVTIYTKNGCQQCKATKRRLDRRGIAYQEIDLDTDPWARIFVRQLGLCITMSSCAGKSPELSSGGACFAQGWRLPSSLVVVSCS